MFPKILTQIFGSRNDRLLKSYRRTAQQINALESASEALDDAALRAKTDEFRERLGKGETIDQLLPEAFAAVREASKRVLKMRQFDVQLIGGIALHEGKIAEMRTGEGKTVTATLGQGAQYAGMGRGLYESEPIFRAAIDRAAAVIAPFLERPLTEVLFPDKGVQTPINETAYTQPALFALEVALAELWSSWGIVPSIVAGHSVGEYAAACLAGVFSFEEGLALIAERGRLMQALPAGGAMAAIFADEARVASMIKGMEQRLAIAALNGPEETVISGDADALAEVLERATRDGVESKVLEVSHAFHSPRLDPMLDALEARAAGVTQADPRIALISNVSGALFAPGSRPDARYWRRHAREPVRFAACIAALKEAGATVVVEIGPHPTLHALAMRAAPDAQWTSLASLRRGRDDAREMRAAAAMLWVRGAPVQLFAPSIISGWLLDTRGRGKMILLGAFTLLLACITAPLSPNVLPLALALFLLGVDWNFCFVGGSTLFADQLSPAERSRTQGFSDLLVGLASATASLSSGFVFAATNYTIISIVAGVLALFPLVMSLFWLKRESVINTVAANSAD